MYMAKIFKNPVVTTSMNRQV